MERPNSGRVEGTSAAPDCSCQSAAAAAVVAAGYAAVAGTWHSSEIEDWRTQQAYRAGKENRARVEMGARE